MIPGPLAAQRVERIGDATLYLGDCREIMPALHADVICTDPVWPNCPPGAIAGSADPLGLWRSACAVMPAHIRCVVTMRCDSDPRFLSAYGHLEFFRVIQMAYAVPGYLGRVLGGDEYAYWFGAPPRTAPGRMVVPGRAPIETIPKSRRGSNAHPMPRTSTHFDWLVEWCSDPGEVVLDPFMGSGTTIVAGLRAGRSAIGIEIDPAFFDIACERVEAEVRAPRLPLIVPEPALQEAML